MSTDRSLSTPLVDAVRRTHVAEPTHLPHAPNTDAAESEPRQHPAPAPRRAKRPGGRKTYSGRRAIRLAILVGLLLVCGIWLARNNGLAGLFSQANSAATELATTNSVAADA